MKKIHQKTKRVIIIITITLFTLLFIANDRYQNRYMDIANAKQYGNMPDYADVPCTIDELFNSSDLIVEGKVIDYEAYSDHGITGTLETVKVTKALKGDISKGDHIIVYIKGACRSWVAIPTIQDCPLMDKRGIYMLFLVKNIDGSYHIVAGNKGFGVIKNGKVNVYGNDKLNKIIEDYGVRELEKYITKRVKLIKNNLEKLKINN